MILDRRSTEKHRENRAIFTDKVELEVLEIGLAAGEIDLHQATAEYMKCVEDTAFLQVGR